MDAVKIISQNDKEFWFTWAFGEHLGFWTQADGVQLDVDGVPSMSFRQAILKALR